MAERLRIRATRVVPAGLGGMSARLVPDRLLRRWPQAEAEASER